MSIRFVDRIREDIASVVSRDPAARNGVEVALLYPGVHAIWAHRVSHGLWRRGAKFPARAVSQFARFLTNIEIHPAATLGERLFIDHGAGVVIGETATVGDDVTMYHGVTLGGRTTESVRRHPQVGDRVVIGAGAKLLGAIEVGPDSRIGANAVLVKSVEPASVVVGVPGQVVAPSDGAAERADQPDPLAFAVRSLLRRVEELETRTSAPAAAPPALYRADGVWEATDYAI